MPVLDESTEVGPFDTSVSVLHQAKPDQVVVLAPVVSGSSADIATDFMILKFHVFTSFLRID
jgi:hypothetical protein